MEIEIAGHSGCTIEIVNGGEGLFIVKSTSDPAYADRLRKQAIKQEAFQGDGKSGIRAPRVLDIYADHTCCRVKMEYVYSLHSIAFVENAGREQIDHFLENIIGFVELEIARSELRKVQPAIFIDKYMNVKDNILANEALAEDQDILSWFSILDRIFSKKMSFDIPVGLCHGDLTFSNILFSRNSFYLIDFLDSFIETPLLDIVKLRQDTAFNWSGLMYSGVYDRVRHAIVLRFMDKRIDDAFSFYPWYRDAYSSFQLLNFLRILQYARERRVVKYLKKNITFLLENYG